MCEFISWKRATDGTILFLMDKDVFSKHGRKTLAGSKDNDFIGHGAIAAFFGKGAAGAVDFEDQRFWNPKNFPPEIAEHLASPETMLAAWGRMLKESLQPDDASYILQNAPLNWRTALAPLLLSRMAKDAKCSYLILCDAKGLTKKERDLFVSRVAKDAGYSYLTIRDVEGLTKEERDLLVSGVAKDAGYSYFTIRDVEGLTKKERDLLVSGVAKDAGYSYCTLRDVEGLTKKERDLLVSRTAKDAGYSHCTLRDAKGLTKEERDLLVSRVAKDAEYSYYILCNAKGLTKKQKGILRKSSSR